ncbi:MAG: VanZ family protein [Bacteroidia bacterium]
MIFIFWLLFIASSCLLPARVFTPFALDTLFQFDKLLHLLAFYALCASLIYIIQAPSLQHKILVVFAAIGYGLLIEYIQGMSFIGRSFEWGDLIADTFGAILGVFIPQIYIKSYQFLKKYLPFVK